MIQMEVRVCTIDKVPYEVSHVYKTMVEEYGEAFANGWTDVVDVPGDDDP